MHSLKVYLALLVTIVSISPLQANALPVDCVSGAGLPCVAEVGDVLAGGFLVGNAGGTDTESAVEAAILSATGVSVDVDLFGASDDNPSLFNFSNFDTGSSLTGSTSGDWSVVGGTLISFVSVKAANGFKLFEFDAAVAAGSYDTLGLLNPGSQQPTVSHIRFWTTAGTPPPTGQIPEPTSAALLLAAIGSGAMIRRGKK